MDPIATLKASIEASKRGDLAEGERLIVQYSRWVSRGGFRAPYALLAEAQAPFRRLGILANAKRAEAPEE